MNRQSRWGYIALIAVALAFVVALFPTPARGDAEKSCVIPKAIDVVCQQIRTGQTIVMMCMDRKGRTFNIIRPRDQA